MTAADMNTSNMGNQAADGSGSGAPPGGDRGGDGTTRRAGGGGPTGSAQAALGGSGGSVQPESPIRTVLAGRRFTGEAGGEIRRKTLLG